MATIKLSKAQWEMIGDKTGWIKNAVLNGGWIKTAVLNALLEKGWAKKMPDGELPTAKARGLPASQTKDCYERHGFSEELPIVQ